MRLGWDEIKRRAKRFSDEWHDAKYEKQHTHSFYNAFFEIFGIKTKQVVIYEQRVELLNEAHGYIDLFWPGTLLVEQKSKGKNLRKAQSQALDYVEGVPQADQPRYVLACDFQNWVLLELETGEELTFKLADLPKHITAFGFMLGRQVSFEAETAVTIKAAELMGKLHDGLEASGYVGHDLEQLLVRLLFCLFADDTGIFQPKDIFYQLIENDTRSDGTDTGNVLNELFDVLDTPESSRQKTLRAELNAFPHVNGSLFTGRLRTASFTKAMREQLLEAARHDWSGVSPAIFGSLFQSVMNAKERRAQGAHYTSEENILKVIGPLFLDDLKAELAAIETRRTNREGALKEFLAKLTRLTFFDPACGCGNFLVIAYREIRRLELRALELLYGKQANFTVAGMSRVTVDQFYGIEIDEFPARIAEVALWMMDHITNNEVNLAFGLNYANIPLKGSPHILHGDALEADWAAHLPPEKCTYVFGNPPFVGAKYQSERQRQQVRAIARLGGSGGTLDFVTGWFIKAGQYLQANNRIRIAFVATNSITQGEQVAQLWPILFDRYGLEILFAHRTFSWTSEARGMAHVHVVIIGLTHRDNEPKEKRLFSYPDIKGDPVESRHEALTAYLFAARGITNRHLVVKEEGSPINGARRLASGSQPIDGGHLIFTSEQRAEFLAQEPMASKWLRRYVGAEDFINGGERWILALQGASPSDLRAMPRVMDRLAEVRKFRSESQRESTLAIASQPTKFNVEVIPATPYLAVPEVSSERRDYVPLGWLEPPTIPSNKLRLLPDATLFEFGVLTSRMHMAWLIFIGGRLKSDFQYGIGVVYNTFPWPEANPGQRAKIEQLAQAVLDARAAHPNASLADLYDPDTMPGDLRKAHAALDKAIDKLYRPTPFDSDRDRVEHLFGRYEALVSPMLRNAAAPRKRAPRSKAALAARKDR